MQQSLESAVVSEIDDTDVPDEVMSIGIEATDVTAWSTTALDLFDGALTCSQLKPMELIDRLQARLGSEALQGLMLVDDHRPEFAWTPLEPGSKQPSVAFEHDARRPLWLFEPPCPVEIEQFQLLSGPERIESGWWEDTVARDYFIAVHENGAQCWLYASRDRHEDNGRWFLHGYFS